MSSINYNNPKTHDPYTGLLWDPQAPEIRAGGWAFSARPIQDGPIELREKDHEASLLALQGLLLAGLGRRLDEC